MGIESGTGGKDNSRKPEGNTSGINRGEATRKVGIDDQQGRLADMQLGHFDRFISTGLADTVGDLLGVGADEPIGQPMAAVSHNPKTGASTYAVLLGKIGVNSEGFESRSLNRISVAEVDQGKVFPKDGFTNKEADIVIGMVNELEEAKKSGLLPDLNGTCTDIASAHYPMLRRDKK